MSASLKAPTMKNVKSAALANRSRYACAHHVELQRAERLGRDRPYVAAVARVERAHPVGEDGAGILLSVDDERVELALQQIERRLIARWAP